MITMHQAPVRAKRTGRGAKWRATATIDGRQHTADSRNGAPNELARILVAAGIPDQPVQVTHEGLRGHLSWDSLHEMAKWTYAEKGRALRKVRWNPAPDRASFGTRLNENRGDSVSRDPE